MNNSPSKKFPLKPEDYELYEEVGQGVSASVYRALCVPLDELVAIKVLDLEKCSSDLEVIRREVQTMTLLDHPNLLKAHCSFAAGTSLWIVTPYMDCGSCFHIMKYVHPTGFEQSIIATLLFGVLKALVYLHSEGLIHRDVKAGNILVDSKGSVKLADFGVSASLFDSGDRRHARNTFVGTPCWMAPEVMQQLHGYDFKADIWSFGITALELAHGHAPFSNYPPMKVLLMTIQNAPPGLDYERDKKFSKSFKEIVATCLVKDPKKRPTAEKLLKHRFFKYAHSRDYVAQTILDGLPPLGDRFRILKEKESQLLAQNKPMLDDKEQLSQQEYIRGISAWNFNLDDMKKQAALIDDDADIINNPENYDWGCKQKGELDDTTLQEKLAEISNHSDSENSVKSLKSGCSNLGGQDSSTASLPNQSSLALDGQLVHPVECVNGELASGIANVNLRREQNVENPDSSFMNSRNGLVKDRSSKSENSTSLTASAILPSLQHLLQQNSIQREQIMRATRCAQEVSDPVFRNDHIQMSDGPTRERVLESRLMTMEQYNERLVRELHKQKMESAKLEKKIKDICEKE